MQVSPRPCARFNGRERAATHRTGTQARNLAASVYCTILVSSVIVGLAQTNLSAGVMMAAVAVTALVFALAHAWSMALASSAEDRQALSAAHVFDGIRHEWPMVEAVGPALLALVPAALGVYSANAAMGRDRRQHGPVVRMGHDPAPPSAGTPAQLVAAGLTTASLGLVLVLLKALLH